MQAESATLYVHHPVFSLEDGTDGRADSVCLGNDLGLDLMLISCSKITLFAQSLRYLSPEQ